MLIVKFAHLEIGSAAERYRTSMAKYLPKPLRTLYRGGRAWAVNGVTSSNTAAVSEIKRQCHEKSDFGHTPHFVSLPLGHSGRHRLNRREAPRFLVYCGVGHVFGTAHRDERDEQPRLLVWWRITPFNRRSRLNPVNVSQCIDTFRKIHAPVAGQRGTPKAARAAGRSARKSACQKHRETDGVGLQAWASVAAAKTVTTKPNNPIIPSGFPGG